MLQSVWLRLRGSRSLLPARDLFDADLDRARRKPGCALCRLIREHDQQTMRSFLWEYCTDPHIGMNISKSWGFCPSHTWSLAILEHERMGDGLGITIVYQALLRQLFRFISSGHRARKQSIPPILPSGPEVGSTNCRFCQAAQREESLFLSRMVKRFQQVMSSDGERDWSPIHTTLCLPHLQQFLQHCAQEGAVLASRRYSSLRQRSQSVSLKASWQAEMQSLTASLSRFTLRSVSGLSSRAQAMQPVWSQLAQRLALLVGNREALPVFIRTSTQQTAPRQLLLVTGRRSQLQSLSNEACPICSAEASACTERCLRIFELGTSLSTIGSLCQSHHWILAASIVLQQRTEGVKRYRSWLEQQLEQQLAALARDHEDSAFQGEQSCMGCALAVEVGSEVISSIVQGLLQDYDDSMATRDRLLCLNHWRQVHERCSSEPDSLMLQQRLLHQQRQRLTALDRNVEVYLARFNAVRRERGEVPDIPEAGRAWERLLAFFVGEPALVYSLADDWPFPSMVFETD
jgi:Family of unknown function (DUF6062)